jgi:competence protein ComEC
MRLLILGFVIGAWLLQQQARLPGLRYMWALPLMALLVWLAWRFVPKHGHAIAKIFLLLLATGVGFYWAAWRADQRLSDALPTAWEGQDVSVVGVVASLPQLLDRGTRFEFDVEKIITANAVIPQHISLTWYQDNPRKKDAEADEETTLPEIHAGERWQLVVRLRKPHGLSNPDGFDYEAWALERNIRATGYIRTRDAPLRVSAKVNRPAYLIDRLREQIRQRFDEVLPDKPLAPVLIALAVGDQTNIPPSQWQVFWRTGVGHLMSISGLHITMVASLFYGLAYWLWRRSARLTQRLPARKVAVIAGMLAGLAYSLIAGFSVPTQRTFYMLATVAVFLWMGRLSSPSRILCAALFMVALADPWAVLSPGFWLSFGAVGALMYASAGRTGRIHWLKSALIAQAAVTLVMAPLLLVLFQQVSLISPLANAIAIPLVSFVVTPLALLGAIPPLDFCLELAHKAMEFCMLFLEWTAQLPHAVWQSHAPPAWTAVVGVLGMLWLLAPRGMPARWLGAVWALPMFLIVPDKPGPGELWLTVLDVGQGLSVVAQTQHHALLYDTGPAYSEESDAGGRIIVPYLRAAGITQLDGLVVTHVDSDHSGGAISVLSAVPTGWMLSSLNADSEIHKYSNKSKRCENEQSWDWDGVMFEILHPTADNLDDDSRKINNNGCVLKLTSTHGGVLLTADIEQLAEEELLEREANLKADVLVAPHHGSKTSSTQEFIDAVNPKTVIFTTGYRNRFGHPKAEVVERYVEHGAQILRSDVNGAVLLRFDQHHSIGKTTWRQHRVRYWMQ